MQPVALILLAVITGGLLPFLGASPTLTVTGMNYSEEGLCISLKAVKEVVITQAFVYGPGVSKTLRLNYPVEGRDVLCLPITLQKPGTYQVTLTYREGETYKKVTAVFRLKGKPEFTVQSKETKSSVSPPEVPSTPETPPSKGKEERPRMPTVRYMTVTPTNVEVGEEFIVRVSYPGKYDYIEIKVGGETIAICEEGYECETSYVPTEEGTYRVVAAIYTNNTPIAVDTAVVTAGPASLGEYELFDVTLRHGLSFVDEEGYRDVLFYGDHRSVYVEVNASGGTFTLESACLTKSVKVKPGEVKEVKTSRPKKKCTFLLRDAAGNVVWSKQIPVMYIAFCEGEECSSKIGQVSRYVRRKWRLSAGTPLVVLKSDVESAVKLPYGVPSVILEGNGHTITSSDRYSVYVPFLGELRNVRVVNTGEGYALLGKNSAVRLRNVELISQSNRYMKDIIVRAAENSSCEGREILSVNSPGNYRVGDVCHISVITEGEVRVSFEDTVSSIHTTPWVYVTSADLVLEGVKGRIEGMPSVKANFSDVTLANWDVTIEASPRERLITGVTRSVTITDSSIEMSAGGLYEGAGMLTIRNSRLSSGEVRHRMHSYKDSFITARGRFTIENSRLEVSNANGIIDAWVPRYGGGKGYIKNSELLANAAFAVSMEGDLVVEGSKIVNTNTRRDTAGIASSGVYTVLGPNTEIRGAIAFSHALNHPVKKEVVLKGPVTVKGTYADWKVAYGTLLVRCEGTGINTSFSSVLGPGNIEAQCS